MVRVDSWPHIAHNQRTWLRVEGTKIDGSAYEKDLWRGPSNWVSVGWYQQGYGEKSIPYDDLLGLRDGSTLKLEFKASFNQSTDVDQATTFPLRTYTIRAALDLRAPSVKQATGTAPSQQLNPVVASTALTVEIPDYRIQPGDQVSVTWTGSAGEGSHTSAPQALPDSREIPVPVSVIAYNLGKPVTVTYRVTRNGDESDPSAPLNLAVQSFAENDLPKPKILDAANNGDGTELDLGNVTGSTTVRIDGWPHIAVGQYVWLRLKGRKADGSVHDRTVWEAPSRVTPSEYDQGFLRGNVPYDYLQDLGDGSTLTVEFKVDFSKTTDEANAITFPLRTYTVRAALDLSAPRVKQATGSSPDQLLRPEAAKDNLTVVIPDYGIQFGDLVSVTWAGTAGGGSHTTRAQTLPDSREIDLPVSVVAFNVDKSVTLTYTVTRGGAALPTSIARAHHHVDSAGRHAQTTDLAGRRRWSWPRPGSEQLHGQCAGDLRAVAIDR